MIGPDARPPWDGGARRSEGIRVGPGLAGPGLAAAALLAALAACGDGGPEGPAHAVRDSAGVELVESARPAWGDGERWSVGAEPLLRIGVVEGERPYQLSGVTGAARLSDGAVAVADAGSNEVRLFDADGGFVTSVGGSGGGPGEFRRLAALGHGRGDTLWAYDFSLRRITRIDPSGRVAGMTSLGSEPAMLGALGALPDGTFVLRQLWAARRTAGAAAGGFRRDPVAFVRFDRSGELRDTVGLFPGRELVVSFEDGRGVMSTPLFARNAVGAVRDGRVVVGSQDRWEIDERAPAGGLLRRIRIRGPNLSVGPDDVERVIAGRVGAAPPERRAALRRRLESSPVPEARPAYGGLLADAAGNLWVSEWAPHPRIPRRWTVLDPRGRWLGDVTMPPAFRPLDIGGDWIVGVERDSLDVERVVLRRLRKGG